MKRIPVTGGAGFIGSHLCERLLARDHEEICVASPIHYQNDPVRTVKTSVHGAINMLRLARRLTRVNIAPRPGSLTIIGNTS